MVTKWNTENSEVCNFYKQKKHNIRQCSNKAPCSNITPFRAKMKKKHSSRKSLLCRFFSDRKIQNVTYEISFPFLIFFYLTSAIKSMIDNPAVHDI